MHSTTILGQIEALTEEYIDLCAHYESLATYLFPTTAVRMREIQTQLNGPGGLWEQRRAEIAAENAKLTRSGEPPELLEVVSPHFRACGEMLAARIAAGTAES